MTRQEIEEARLESLGHVERQIAVLRHGYNIRGDLLEGQLAEMRRLKRLRRTLQGPAAHWWTLAGLLHRWRVWTKWQGR